MCIIWPAAAAAEDEDLYDDTGVRAAEPVADDDDGELYDEASHTQAYVQSQSQEDMDSELYHEGGGRQAFGQADAQGMDDELYQEAGTGSYGQAETQGVCARALYDYQAGPFFSLTFLIVSLKWVSKKLNYKLYQEAGTGSYGQAETQGVCARALYGYQAGPLKSLTFLIVSRKWVSKKLIYKLYQEAGTGSYGQAETQGVCARALYDYQAGPCFSLTFFSLNHSCSIWS